MFSRDQSSIRIELVICCNKQTDCSMSGSRFSLLHRNVTFSISSKCGIKLGYKKIEGQLNNVNKIKSPSGSCKTVQIKRPNGFVINNKQTN